MRRTIVLTTLGVFCFLCLGIARQATARPANADGAVPAQSSGGTVYYCASSWQQSVVYFSAPFETDELNRTSIQEAYSQFLKQKYSYADGASSVVCSISQSLTSAQSDKGGDEDSVKRAAHSIVETGWKYRGATATATAAAPNRSATTAASHATPTAAHAPVPAPPAAASAAPTASAAPSPAPSPVQRPAAAAASAQMYYTLCRYQGQKDGHPIMYVTPIIHTDAAAGTINQAFYTYMTSTYDVSKIQYGSGYCRQVGASADQQVLTMSTLEKQWAASKTEVTHVNWTDSPADVAATNAKVASAAAKVAAATATASPTATYVVCASDRAGPVVYFSDIFAADLPVQSGKTGNGGQAEVMMGKIRNAYSVFLTQKYSFKDNSNYPVECGGGRGFTGAASLHAAQTYEQSLKDLANQQKHQIVETGWKNQ
jgi:hypothetical protein